MNSGRVRERHGSNCRRGSAARQENSVRPSVHLRHRSQQLGQDSPETGISPDARVRDLRDAEVARLLQVIERDYKVEDALRTVVAMNIKRLIYIKKHRGSRH